MLYYGGVWVTQEVLDRVPKAGSSFPSIGEAYRWQTLRYADADGSVRRYTGFHAQLVSQQGKESIFRIWSATAEVALPSSTLISVYVTDPAHVDTSNSDNFTMGQQGKLFLNWNLLRSVSAEFLSPKLPIGDGKA
jgi:hypothetical protein